MKTLLLIVLTLTLFFRFALDEYVVTPFDHVGIVCMIGQDHGGAFYRVQTCNGTMTFREWQLKAWQGAR